MTVKSKVRLIALFNTPEYDSSFRFCGICGEALRWKQYKVEYDAVTAERISLRQLVCSFWPGSRDHYSWVETIEYEEPIEYFEFRQDYEWTR